MNTWQYLNRAWQYEHAYTLGGNGFIGGRIPLDGHGARGNSFTSEIAGFYIGDDEVMCDVPHPLNAPIWIDGEVVRPVWGNGYFQKLDLREGCYQTSYTDATGKVRVETEFFFHRERRHVAAYRLTIQARHAVEIEIAPQLSTAHLRRQPQTSRFQDGGKVGWTLDYGDLQRRTAQVISIGAISSTESGVKSEVLPGEGNVGRSFKAQLQGGDSVTLEVLVATTTGGEPLGAARQEAESAQQSSYDALKREHVAAMQDIWRHFDISCADPFLERRARSALFYLLTCFREDVVWGGAATGLAGSSGGWGGCVFWDTEFYMFPALLPLFPNLAKNTVLYRYQTMAGARQNALDNGEDGLRYAWESRRSGREFAGHFAAERHIGSDVAFAAWWYARSTGDTTFWKQQGSEILLGVARFWASRARWDDAKNRCRLPDVIPPDEHVADHYRDGLVSDSVMTNAYAAWTLYIAAQQEQATPAEVAHWCEIATQMYLPRDEQRGLWLEYEDYDDHPIKQADVGHLFFPLDPGFIGADATDIKRNVLFYADRERETGIGIFHSPFVYGAAMSRAGDVAGVRRFLDQSWMNVSGGYDTPRELLHTTNPTLTATGSFLSLLLYGVLGLENMGQELTSHPCVPENVGEISLAGIRFGDGVYQIKAQTGDKAPCHLQRID